MLAAFLSALLAFSPVPTPEPSEEISSQYTDCDDLHGPARGVACGYIFLNGTRVSTAKLTFTRFSRVNVCAARGWFLAKRNNLVIRSISPATPRCSGDSIEMDFSVNKTFAADIQVCLALQIRGRSWETCTPVEGFVW